MATTRQRIKLRRDTAANWTAVNPVLAAGEIGYETDSKQAKVGDGSSVWSALEYASWNRNPILNSVQISTTGGITPVAGQVVWDSDDQGLNLGLPGDVTAHLGSETTVLCRNHSNTVAIPKGTAVRFAGAVGNSGRIKVAPMVADGSLPGYVFFGVTDQAIAGGADGYVTTFGKIRGVNTSAYADGDILWCDPAVPGGFTVTEPAAPNLKLAVAAVISAANNGTIFVRWTTGSRLKDLHDVESNGSTNDGDVLVWNDAANRWETQELGSFPVDTLTFDTTASASISTGQVAWDAPNATPVVRHRPNVIGRLGQDQHCLCKNTSAVPLIKGRVVMFTGADSVSGRIEIGPLLANGQYPGYVYFGVTAEAIAIGEFGMVCTFGFIEGIDTSIYPEDSVLWACTVNPGAMVLEQNLQPAPALSIPTAVVVKSDPVDGVIFVRANTGAELRLLHDVYTDLAEDGDVLTWIDNLNRWESKPPVNDAPRSITIAGPQIGDSFTLFRTTRETTITSAIALVSGGSVTYELRYAADRTTAGTLATVSDTVTNTTTGDAATVQNQPIAVDSYVWVEITAVSGTVDEFNLSVAF